MGNYSLVLSDELQAEYYEFMDGRPCNSELIKKLLFYYKAPILTNTSQLKRINRTVDKQLEAVLRKSGFTTQPLEDLVKNTVYKVILSTDKDQYPYVNINRDKIENNLSGCFFRHENRRKAIEHITALCSKAGTIYLYDRHFSDYEGEKNVAILKRLFPQKELTIIYHPEHFLAEDIERIKTYCPKWMLKQQILTSQHDRYLIIDDKIEIILTSGFAYLNNTEKEFTYIVRTISENRF